MTIFQQVQDGLRQQAHAERVREDRQIQDLRQTSPQVSQFLQLMQIARDTKPHWHGRQTAAERHTYANPHNLPRVERAASQNHHSKKGPSRSGVEGGSITFVVCKDNGDGSFTQGKVTADATFVADV